MNLIRLTVFFVLCLPSVASSFQVYKVELCMDKHFVHKVSGIENKKIDELKCEITIQKDEPININDFKKLYTVVSVSNIEPDAHRELEIHWVFQQDIKVREANTFPLSNTYYSEDFGLLTQGSGSKTKYMLLEEKYKDTGLGTFISVVFAMIKPAKHFRTYSSKAFDKNLHIGQWKLIVVGKENIDGKNIEYYSKDFMVFKK